MKVLFVICLYRNGERIEKCSIEMQQYQKYDIDCFDMVLFKQTTF